MHVRARHHRILYGSSLSTSSHILCPIIAYCMVDESGSLERCFCIVYGSAPHLHRVSMLQRCILYGPAMLCSYGQHRIPSTSRAMLSRTACYGDSSALCGQIRILYGSVQRNIWSAVAYYMRLCVRRSRTSRSSRSNRWIHGSRPVPLHPQAPESPPKITPAPPSRAKTC